MTEKNSRRLASVITAAFAIFLLVMVVRTGGFGG